MTTTPTTDKAEPKTTPDELKVLKRCAALLDELDADAALRVLTYLYDRGHARRAPGVVIRVGSMRIQESDGLQTMPHEARAVESSEPIPGAL